MNIMIVLKRLLVLAFLFAMTFSTAKAQDLIVTQNGETIRAYRTDVGNKSVYYRLEDNDEMPILSIPKSEVLVVKMHNGETIVMEEDNVQPEVTNYYPIEPVADPEVIAKAEIGSLIEFYDGSKGIVFYLDGNGHGLAVNLNEYKGLVCWQDVSSWRDCIDVNGIPNERETEIQMGLGIVYCDAAIKQLGLEEIPAIKWCRSIGPDWYLPSLGELYQLLVIANMSRAGFGPISKALKDAGGNRLRGTMGYYSCSEDDNTNVFVIYPSDGVAIAKKYDRHNCRAIRMF